MLEPQEIAFFDRLPKEILHYTLSFLDPESLRKAQTVSKRWNIMLSAKLIRHYYNHMFSIKSNLSLLNIVNRLNKDFYYQDFYYQDTDSVINKIFHSYMIHTFKYSTTESLMGYVEIVSQKLINDTYSYAMTKDFLLDYLNNQKKKFEHCKNFLLYTNALYRYKCIQKSYLSQKGFSLLPTTRTFMARLFWTLSYLESFLTMLTLFQNLKRMEMTAIRNASLKEKLELLKSHSTMLTGNGLVALTCSSAFPQMIEELIRMEAGSLYSLYPKECTLILSRLKPKHIVAYLKALREDLYPFEEVSYQPFVSALKRGHPPALRWFTAQSLASYDALCLLMKTHLPGLINVCGNIYYNKHSLASVLTHSGFLNRYLEHRSNLNSKTHIYTNAAGFVEWAFKKKALVALLLEDDILKLLKILLKRDLFSCITNLFKHLSSKNRLTRDFLLKVVQQYPSLARAILKINVVRRLTASDPSIFIAVKEIRINSDKIQKHSNDSGIKPADSEDTTNDYFSDSESDNSGSGSDTAPPDDDLSEDETSYKPLYQKTKEPSESGSFEENAPVSSINNQKPAL